MFKEKFHFHKYKITDFPVKTKYSIEEMLKIVDRCESFYWVKNPKKLTENDAYLPVYRHNKIYYMVANQEDFYH